RADRGRARPASLRAERDPVGGRILSGGRGGSGLRGGAADPRARPGRAARAGAPRARVPPARVRDARRATRARRMGRHGGPPAPGRVLHMPLGAVGDGLTQRRATAADTDAVVAFTADVLRHQDAAGPDDQTGAWTRDLMQGRHPTFAPDDFLLVEDRRTGAIVSAACLISQTWSYGGVPTAVRRPGLIGTRAEYRGRGLVRAQLDTVHAWSARRAQELLAIDGIPWFYRQFGYEMALALRGGQSIEAARIAAGGSSYRVREASDADVPFMARTAAASADRYLVACPRDEALWSYELNGHHERSTYAPELRVVETPAGEPIGFLAHLGRLVGGELITVAAELASGKSWRSAAPSVLRYLRSTGEAYAAHEGGSCERLVFWFGDEHPAAPALATLSPR